MSKGFMSSRNEFPGLGYRAGLTCLLVVLTAPAVLALETDRQQPLEVNADDTQGSLGDGTTVLSGRVEIRQGTLHIMADRAEVTKADGRVQMIVFRGEPARLEQEIEQQGLVQAEADTITYQVAAGKVELAGNGDVNHPQYHISGETLTYDLDQQHFEGSGAGSQTGDGRISIRMEPEVASELGDRDEELPPEDAPEAAADDDSESP